MNRRCADALDLMNNKQAIQLADKILKKQKDLHCAKVCFFMCSWRAFYVKNEI
jgi:hypothetical protein